MRGAAALLGGVLLLAGCAGTGPEAETRQGALTEAYPHRVGSSNVELLWRCERPEPSLVRVEGLARNPWSAQPIGYLEVEVAATDAAGRPVGSGRGAADNWQIRTGQASPFAVLVRLTGEPARLDLWYQYQFHEENILGRLAGPGAPRPSLAASSQRSLVRDACSPTQHRVR